MLAKLAMRNVKRCARDYLIYVLTMMLVTAVMFAFHSLLFSKDVQKLFEAADLMQIMIGLATFFVVLITAWLINYMVRFMLDKRSRELGIYLLLGMSKRQLARLHLRESLLLGAGAFAGGVALGILLQQILMAVFYSVIQIDHKLRLEWSGQGILLTAACYSGCYLLALLRCHFRFHRLNICALMNVERQNEEIKESNEKYKQWLLPLSCVFLLIFGLFLFLYRGWGAQTILFFLLGLIVTIYLFYIGLAAAVICYISRKGSAVYQAQNLFLLRQFSSKIKTMRFTLGTLTSLFTLALLGCAAALMFHHFQDQILADKWPFDVQIYSGNLQDDFIAERKLLAQEASVQEIYTYPVYHNHTREVNSWLYTHLAAFPRSYQKPDGSADWEKIQKEDNSYYPYDTYLALSDYNQLRQMLGYETVTLSDHSYLIHLKERIWKETKDLSQMLHILGPNGELHFAGAYTEPFSQDGHNGCDYLLIVPDALAGQMKPYYKELVAKLDKPAPNDLQEKLDALAKDGSIRDFGDPVIDKTSDETSMCIGSDTIVAYAGKNLVGSSLVPEVKFMLTSVIFPLFYMGLVFICVALTVLCVQQLSDSSRYRFRYQVLHQIGLSRKEISGVVLRQLAAFYLCPMLFAAVVSGITSIYMGWNFNRYTGAHISSVWYFGISFGAFSGVYLVYFVITYLGFLRNIE